MQDTKQTTTTWLSGNNMTHGALYYLGGLRRNRGNFSLVLGGSVPVTISMQHNIRCDLKYKSDLMIYILSDIEGERSRRLHSSTLFVLVNEFFAAFVSCKTKVESDIIDTNFIWSKRYAGSDSYILYKCTVLDHLSH